MTYEKEEEEVKLIAKKANKSCKFNNNNTVSKTKSKSSKRQQSAIMSSHQEEDDDEEEEEQQQFMANNNDDSFISEYRQDNPHQLLLSTTNDYINNVQQPQDGRVSGGSNKSLSSTSSAFYDENEECEVTNNLLVHLSSTTNEQSHHLISSSSTNSLLSSTTTESSSDHSGRSSANKSPDSLNGNCNINRQFHQDNCKLISPSSSFEEQQEEEKVDSIRFKKEHKFSLNPIPNLIPESDNYHNMVDRIRVKFLETIGDNLENDTNKQKLKNEDIYDKNDIDEFKKPLPPINEQEQSLTFRLITRYLNNKQVLDLIEKKERNEDDNNHLDNQIEQCVESLKSLLKFRQQYKLSNVLEEQFSREFYLLSGAFVFGHDKQNLPVFYMRARVHRRWSKSLDETFRRYLSWQLDLVTKSNHGVSNVQKSIGYNGIEKDGSFGICFDCGDIGYSCVDMDFLKFIVNLLVNFYPTYCRYALCVDLPWLFRSVWKLVRSWLPEDAQNSVQLITSKQLIDFIDEDQIPNCMKVNDLKAKEKPIANKHSFPQNWSSIKGIDEFGKDMNLSSSEIKQFKTHADKLRKEYESMGAI